MARGAPIDHTEVYVVAGLVLSVLGLIAYMYTDTQQRMAIKKRLLGEKLV